MMSGIRNIVSAILLLIMLTTTVVRLEHHHEHPAFHCDHEKDYPALGEKCLICSYEFSLYEIGKSPLSSEITRVLFGFTSSFSSTRFSEHSKYSFQLRAPPLFPDSSAFPC